MNAERFQLKLYASDPDAVELEPFVPLFHRWIQGGKLEELLIDVADYSHVPDGPGVVLIGHASDYYIDLDEGRPGLLYSRKREAEGDFRARLADTFRRTLRAAQLIEQDDTLGGRVRFGTSEMLFRINDRLAAPNSDETYEAVHPELEGIVSQLFAGGTAELSREGTERELFTVRIRTEASESVGTVLERLG